MSRYAGVDLGTSGMKTVVLDADGDVVSESAAQYATDAPHPGWCEIDPYRWVEAYERCAVEGVDAIAFTGQMHGIVLTDDDGTPVRPAILWPDRRAGTVLAAWLRDHPTLIASLGGVPSPGYAGAILGWLAAYEPDTLVRSSRLWFAKDWLRAYRCGRWLAVTDRSDACASLLWDAETAGWSPGAARLAGISPAILPDILSSTDPVGAIGDAVAVIGGADTATALDAYRAIAPPSGDSVYVNIGTGVQIVRPAQHRAELATTAGVFADTGTGWYAMRALERREFPTRAALLDAIADAVADLESTDVVVGGGVTHDIGFRTALARRLGRSIRYAAPRSLSACGAAILAARSMGRRIGLRQVAEAVESDGSDR